MKKLVLLAISAVIVSSSLMAGGIMTNTNQSAAYARMLARNASLGIDAVYYNPAGLTKLGNGLYFSLNNQSIFQTKDVVNSYSYLNASKFTGIVKAPLFPGIYAAYKMNKFAFSFGFNPVGGGGGATYDTGLPSFEMGISDLVPSLNAKAGVTDYQATVNFEGASTYFGYQAGISYEINPAVSVYAGVRYVTAKNTYVGSIKDIKINPTIAGTSYSGDFMRADLFGTQQAAYYTGVAGQYTTAATGAGGLADAGLGTYTFAQAQAAGFISAAQQAAFEGALLAVGQPANTPIATAELVYTATAGQATAGAAQMTGMAAKTGDADVDVVQTGKGITPIIGVNLTLAEKLTLAIKYEFLTKIELTNETNEDGTGTFVDGAKSRSDMPAMISIGAAYPVTEKFKASLGFNYYFDKGADYSKKDTLGNYVANKDVIDNNYYELALGLEYNITEKFLVSAGFNMANTGVSKAYQTDLSYSLSSNTVAGGAMYQLTPGIGLNIGALYTMYGEDSKTFNHKLGTNYIPVTEDYSKTTWLVSFGLDIKLGK